MEETYYAEYYTDELFITRTRTSAPVTSIIIQIKDLKSTTSGLHMIYMMIRIFEKLVSILYLNVTSAVIHLFEYLMHVCIEQP